MICENFLIKITVKNNRTKVSLKLVLLIELFVFFNRDPLSSNELGPSLLFHLQDLLKIKSSLSFIFVAKVSPSRVIIVLPVEDTDTSTLWVHSM